MIHGWNGVLERDDEEHQSTKLIELQIKRVELAQNCLRLIVIALIFAGTFVVLSKAIDRVEAETTEVVR